MEKIGRVELMLYWQPTDQEELPFLYIVGVFDGYSNQEHVFETRKEAERQYAKLKRKFAARLAVSILSTTGDHDDA